MRTLKLRRIITSDIVLVPRWWYHYSWLLKNFRLLFFCLNKALKLSLIRQIGQIFFLFLDDVQEYCGKTLLVAVLKFRSHVRPLDIPLLVIHRIMVFAPLLVSHANYFSGQKVGNNKVFPAWLLDLIVVVDVRILWRDIQETRVGCIRKILTKSELRLLNFIQILRRVLFGGVQLTVKFLNLVKFYFFLLVFGNELV